MAYTKLTDAQCREAVAEYEAAGHNASQAAMALGLSHGSMQNRLRRAKQRGIVPAPPPARESLHAGRRLAQTADECWALLDDFIGRSPRKAAPAPRRDRTPRQRIVIAGDFHVPFQCTRSVAELIRREGGQTDTLIIAGDFTDSYSYSRFVRFEAITPEAEWAACDALLGQLAAVFPEIICVQGNHDARLERQLRAQLSPELMFAVERLTGGVLDPLQAIAKRYPNVRFQGHQVGRHGIGWFTQFGDVIVSHAEKFSRVPGAATRAVEEWFRDQHDTLGLKPWRILAQAHTHQLSAVYWGSDKLMVETACLSSTHGYQLQAKVGGRPQRRGWVRLEQSAGVTDVNSVRLIWLDPELREAVA